MKRITPRTCLWPLTGCLAFTFALSIGLTYRSDHYCYAGVCGEVLFPLQARLHVVVWYLWISLSVSFLGLRAFRPSVRHLVSKPLGIQVPIVGKQLRLSGVLLVLWVLLLYGVLIGVWWVPLRDYFEVRGQGLPGNSIVAAIAQTGHFADVTMGMVLLPVSRHSALASFFKLTPTTTYTFHMTMAYILFGLVIIHGSLYADWVALYNGDRSMFRHILPVLNPTYLYNEVWPGSTSSLGVWRASLIFTGSISGIIMIAMFFTSFAPIRRNYFNLFYFTHLLGIVAVVVVCLHASTLFYCTAPGLSMWLLDWGMRFFELRQKLNSRLRTLGNGWFSLTLPLPRTRLSGCACHSPLAHFYIHHSNSSILEIHPFTTITHLASKKTVVQDMKNVISIQFLFRESVSKKNAQKASQQQSRKGTQWTNRLASLVADDEAAILPPRRGSEIEGQAAPETCPDVEKLASYGAETTLRLEGPYFTPANPERFKTVVCLVAGTGLSGALAIAAAFQAERAKPRSVAVRQSQVTGAGAVEATFTASVKGGTLWERCVVLWTVREKDFVDMPFFEELKCEGLEFRVHKTGGARPRLDMSAALTEICGEQGEDSWCYISGPTGFITAGERACGETKGLSWFAASWD